MKPHAVGNLLRRCAAVAAILAVQAGGLPAADPAPPLPSLPRGLNEARARFLAVERFARRPAEEQRKNLPAFYRELAPPFLNPIIEGLLSSYPDHILARKGYAAPGGNSTERWGTQLAEAAATLSPEQVADKLEIPLFLNVAGRVRVHAVLRGQLESLAALIAEDLASKELPAVSRACAAITELHLRQFTDRVLTLYLADTPLSKPAHGALIWLADPATVRPLLDAIEKDPQNLARHAGLFQGPLADRPAEPALVKFLDSPDAELRYHAASALSECRDAALAQPIAKLAKDPEARLQIMALLLARRLPEEAFRSVRAELLPLLAAQEDTTRIEALACFARRKDLVAGPPILALLKREKMDPGQAVTVMQSLGALADSTFNYNLHEWGPAANAKAIAKFEAWLQGGTGLR